MSVIQSQFFRGMIVGASVLGAGILLGGAARDDDRPDAVPETVRARQFEVVDELGTVQLVVGSNDRGGTISVHDKFGRTILLAGAAEHGGMLVVTDTRTSAPALTAGAAASGGAIQIFDDAGTRVLDAAAGARGGVLNIARRTADEQAGDGRAMRLEIGEHGGGELTTFSPGGGRLLRLFADAKDAGIIETYKSPTNLPLVTLSSTATGQGQVKTAAPGGEPLVVLTAAEDDRGQIYTFSATGQTLVAIASHAGGPTLRVFNAAGAPAVTLEADDAGDGTVGVWRPDGTGRSLRP